MSIGEKINRALYGFMPPGVQRRMLDRAPIGVNEFSVTLPNQEHIRFHDFEEGLFIKKLFWKGFEGYQPEFSRVFFYLSQAARTIIDLGSYLGYYCLLAGKANPESRIFSVEPLTTSIAFQENVFERNGVKNVIICPAAVSRQSGNARFYIPDYSISRIPNIGSLKNRFGKGTHYPDRASIPVDVESLRLDDLAERYEIREVDLIKFYVEEMEEKVFEGGQRLLERDHPDLIGWIFYRDDNVEKMGRYLRDLSYRFFAFKGIKLIECEALEDARHKGDVFNPRRGGRSAVLCTIRPEGDLEQIQAMLR